MNAPFIRPPEDPRLTPEEIERITGYKAEHRQLEELHAQGFWRARVVRGELILERAHYNAVCAGAVPPGAIRTEAERPKVRA